MREPTCEVCRKLSAEEAAKYPMRVAMHNHAERALANKLFNEWRVARKTSPDLKRPDVPESLHLVKKDAPYTTLITACGLKFDLL